MEHFMMMLVPLLIGFLMVGVGFNYREQEWGVRLLSAGVVLLLVPILVKIYLSLHLA
mgnify:CR=1 FL=1|jgi:hypothetical protein